MTSQPHIHYDLFCYEAFAEESKRLVFYAAKEGLKIGYTPQTIQEAGHTEPPATVISVRTQSIIPVAWGKQLDGLLTRSTGYDHLTDYRRQIGDAATGLQMGYLPLYCAQAVAEQAMLLWMALLRRLPMQLKQFQSFSRDHLTGY